MLTFGKVMAFQQLHKDTPELIYLYNTFSSGSFVSCCCDASRLNLWLIYVSPKVDGTFGTLIYSLENYIRFV